MDNWMKNLPDDLYISEINLPGTHDSAANHVRFKFFSKCQNKNIYEQLKLGVRYIDIRVEKTDDDKLKTVHSIVDCRKSASGKEKLLLDDVLHWCCSFLNENPSETIILCIKRDDGGSSEEAFDCFYKNYLSGNAIWYKENRIPRLSEVRGKIVLFNRCCADNENEEYTDFNTGLNFSGWPEQDKEDMKGFEMIPIPNRSGKTCSDSFVLQDLYRVPPKNKWFDAVYPLLENPPQKPGIIINFFSANNGKHSPKSYSKFMYKMFDKYEMNAGKKYGWLVLDYPTEKYTRKIILTNF